MLTYEREDELKAHRLHKPDERNCNKRLDVERFALHVNIRGDTARMFVLKVPCIKASIVFITAVNFFAAYRHQERCPLARSVGLRHVLSVS